ncbi:MAG: cytochrome b [Gammaproteobacteria bacterium]|nr:cytochrome b [Gammaproteobacteria bacterium]
MNNLNTNGAYDIVSKLLHWTIAVLLIGLIALGWYMMSIEDQPDSGWYFKMHKSFGLIAATLILFRLIWRLFHTPAPLPSSIPLWQAKAARGLHFLLYIFMILMPLTGFLGASFSEHGVNFFSLKLPTWIAENKDISEQFFEAHGIIAWILVTLISLHALAAFKHFFINKDGVFQRMWF